MLSRRRLLAAATSALALGATLHTRVAHADAPAYWRNWALYPNGAELDYVNDWHFGLPWSTASWPTVYDEIAANKPPQYNEACIYLNPADAAELNLHPVRVHTSSDGTNCLALTTDWSPDESRTGWQPTSAPFISTRFTQTHGYWGTLVRNPVVHGVNGCVWLYSESGSVEFDLNEPMGAYYQQTMHGAEGASQNTGFVANTADWNEFGVDVQPDTTTFYANGEATGSYPTPSNGHVPLFMVYSTNVGEKVQGRSGYWEGSMDATTVLPYEYEVAWTIVAADRTAAETWLAGQASEVARI